MKPGNDQRGRLWLHGWKEWAWLFGPALAWILGVVGGASFTLADDRAWGPLNREQARAVGSVDCRRCHPDAYRTWYATYHRTMTQSVTATDAVAAPFGGEHLDYLGFRATMDRTDAGKPRIRVVGLGPDGVPEPGPPLLEVEVVYTVGSHHYQQYVATQEPNSGELWRLPVAWHLGERRWIHMNAAFLEPEGVTGRSEDYLRHLSRWNDNCLFCHNTEPNPGLLAEDRFASEVGELGIACEACHGAGSLHTVRHENPLRRILSWSREDDLRDGSITHPGRLSTARESEVCGRCHGQRIARDIASVLRHGDRFIPGEPLDGVSRPIFRESNLVGFPEHPFAARFWPDGTPRLSAYEYQALLLSPCHEGGKGLGCNDCHDMHGADPAGQLRNPEKRDGVCRDCHPPEALSGVAGTRRHGGHDPPVDCLDCHMPETTYGLLRGMISHRISIPRPAQALGRADRPDACTQCHVNRSRRWAADGLGDLGWSAPKLRPESPRETWASRVVLDLWGGDPVQRALAIHALGGSKVPVALDARLGPLVSALEDDYPALRWMGWRTLQALAKRHERPGLREALGRFDPLDDPVRRTAVVVELQKQVAADPVGSSPKRADTLRAERDDASIWIGE